MPLLLIPCLGEWKHPPPWSPSWEQRVRCVPSQLLWSLPFLPVGVSLGFLPGSGCSLLLQHPSTGHITSGLLHDAGRNELYKTEAWPGHFLPKVSLWFLLSAGERSDLLRVVCEARPELTSTPLLPCRFQKTQPCPHPHHVTCPFALCPVPTSPTPPGSSAPSGHSSGRPFRTWVTWSLGLPSMLFFDPLGLALGLLRVCTDVYE